MPVLPERVADPKPAAAAPKAAVYKAPAIAPYVPRAMPNKAAAVATAEVKAKFAQITKHR